MTPLCTLSIVHVASLPTFLSVVRLHLNVTIVSALMPYNGLF